METESNQNESPSNKSSDSPLSIDEKKKRGQIKKLSYGSTKRARLIMMNLPNEMTHEIGLTYPRNFPKDGKVVKAHLHKMMLRFSYRGIRAFWFMEFQERGACHFHLIIDKPIDEDELKRIWYEIVGSEDTRHRNHGAHISPIRNLGGFKKYLAAYLTKEEQKRIPYFYHNAGRFWGYTRSLVPVTINIIVGPKKDILIMRRNFRLFRKWQEKRYTRLMGKKMRKKKILAVDRFSFFIPGEYLYIRNARKFIDSCKGKIDLPDYLFEDWL